MSSIKLKDTIEWSKKFNFGRNPVIGNNLEPAMTSANTVIQTVLGPPFCWRWNRTEVNPTLTATQQDLDVEADKFGFIETASIQDSSFKWYQIQPRLSLSKDSASARPRFICAHRDTSIADTITFRLTPVPDENYNLNVVYQQRATLFTSVNQTWDPIPDYFSYIYNWGFMAMMWMFADDPRFTMANQKFVSHLLAAAEGLTETQVNIFLSQWFEITGQNPSNMARIQQGEAARQV